ncbi:cytochrome p450 [Moniliophthora roreri MCA 2997]|uniref:Cytochrome p450 n=1 Tax=Moniliophthora roreri (strain MCA 2997) TaxID=1381753 RepID=V2XXQ6_MONRO|nr:cytochrome p450 [Moniliophthora roreri MCA 2997]
MPLYLGVAILLLVLWAIRALRRTRLASPGLTGPPVPSFIFGHALDVAQAPIGTRYNEWEKQYGLTYQLKGPFGKNTLIVNDPKGMNHVLQGRNYQRNSGDTELIKICFGHSLFSAEGEEHRMMRKTVSGALSNQAVHEVSHVFFELAERLIQSWEQQLDGNESRIFDITPDIHRLTLDAVSMTMFAHDLSDSDIPSILKRITHSPPDGPADVLLKTFVSQFPIIMKLPSPIKEWCTAFKTSLGAVAKEVWSGHEAAGMHAKLLDALAKENVPEEIVIANIIGFIFAGSETTANVIIESIYELARNPNIQQHIQTELAEFEAANGRQPTYEDIINSVHLPYFDAFIKEILRTKSVLVTISRTAIRDDVIPLQIPAKSADSHQDVHQIPVKAGTLVEIPIRDGINISETIWGPDAALFDPERWLDSKSTRLPESVKWVHAQGNTLTFGDGQKVCLGRSFALAELKAALISLVRVFRFEEVPGVEFDFYHVGGNTVKPMVRGREKEGTQMLLRVCLRMT